MTSIPKRTPLGTFNVNTIRDDPNLGKENVGSLGKQSSSKRHLQMFLQSSSSSQKHSHTSTILQSQSQAQAVSSHQSSMESNNSIFRKIYTELDTSLSSNASTRESMSILRARPVRSAFEDSNEDYSVTSLSDDLSYLALSICSDSSNDIAKNSNVTALSWNDCLTNRQVGKVNLNLHSISLV